MEGVAARAIPIVRLKQHLIALGEWSEERHSALEKELEAHVTACWKEAVKFGTLTEGPTSIRPPCSRMFTRKCRRTWPASAKS